MSCSALHSSRDAASIVPADLLLSSLLLCMLPVGSDASGSPCSEDMRFNQYCRELSEPAQALPPVRGGLSVNCIAWLQQNNTAHATCCLLQS